MSRPFDTGCIYTSRPQAGDGGLAQALPVASKSIGTALRGRREAEGLSQSAVAGRAGIHAAMLSRIERDERGNPYFSTVAKVAAALGMSLNELAAESGLPSVRRVRTATSPDAVRLDDDLATVARHLSLAQDRLARAQARKLD
jgi:transcriptional regulator with XRE-family HTH domain